MAEDLLHLLEHTFDWKRIFANPNPKAQDEMTSFFEKVYRYQWQDVENPNLVMIVSFSYLFNDF